jgi:anhydro-N-acetylmuramic acid kinase
MRMIAEQLAPAQVETAMRWSVDALEAQAFAFLAVRNLRGLPIISGYDRRSKSMNGGVLVRRDGA